MTSNRELATKIFDHLVSKGAELGDVSVILIESVLNKESDKFFEYNGQEAIIIVKASCAGEALGMINDKLNDEERHPVAGISDVVECTVEPEPYQDGVLSGRGVLAYFDVMNRSHHRD